MFGPYNRIDTSWSCIFSEAAARCASLRGIMRISNTHTMDGRDGRIEILTNEHGIPEIAAHSERDAMYGMGWVHARDRQLQMFVTRVLLQGRAAELLAPDPELIEIDRYMRRMNFLPDALEQMERLEPVARANALAYCDGVNASLQANGRIFEFKLLGLHPEPWSPADSMMLAKIMAFLGLADAQGTMEKLIVQMVQNGLDEKRLKELFPYLTETLDLDLLKRVTLSPALLPASVEWLKIIPRMTASNNWVVSGAASATGRVILCNDPHLEVNRIPGIWYETVLRIGERSLQGVSLPGAPAIAIGRSPELAWGVTYSFMDMIDFRIEECRDGCYRRGEEWLPFRRREERILVRKGEPVIERVYENDLGILEGDPWIPGHYLVMMWSAARGCGAGDFNGLTRMLSAVTVEGALANFRKLESLSFNWIAGDSAGNIGYQMSGRTWKRPSGVSGLVPLPGWDATLDPAGFMNTDDLPQCYNPPEGYIVTANNDLNGYGRQRPINLPMAPYRAKRIAEMIEERRGSIDVEWMKTMHYDLLSLQATRLMQVIRPLLPDTEKGRLLQEWDCRYTAESRAATLFESIYLSLLEVVFGENGVGKDVVRYLLKETGIFNDYYGCFDDVLMNESSSWFAGRSREALFRQAVEQGLNGSQTPLPYGATRKILLTHLLFGGKLPRFLGFDRGPISLPGSRATIPQGQIFRSAGRTTTFAPAYRMVASMAEKGIHTNLAGGPSDRRFSRFYDNDWKNWISGRYKKLE